MANNVRQQRRAFEARHKALLDLQGASGYTRNRTALDAVASLVGDKVDLFGSMRRRARRAGRALAIVEVGAGDGALSERLKLDLFGANVTSIDPLPSRYEHNVAGTFEALPLEDCSQDVVLAGTVHNYTLDKVRALQEAHRVLSTGGLAIMNVHPGMPLVFHSGGQSLSISVRDFVQFLKSRGHSVRLATPNESSINVATLVLRKNKPVLGMRFRWRGAELADSGPAETLESSPWAAPDLELVPHYLTDKRTFGRLKEFARPIKKRSIPGDGY